MSYSVTQSLAHSSIVTVLSVSQTVFVVRSLMYTEVDIAVYVPSVSFHAVTAALQSTAEPKKGMSNAALIGIVSGAASVVAILAGAILFMVRRAIHEDVTPGEKRVEQSAQKCLEVPAVTEEPANEAWTHWRYSLGQTVTTCDCEQGTDAETMMFL
jgi:ABC-type uncharacterized transport system YnjBCD permease subunit